MRSIRDFELDGRAVFMRADLDVPIAGGEVANDTCIQAALRTIRLALEGGARLTVAAHLGATRDKRDKGQTLEPVGVRLSELLDQDVFFSEECAGDGVRRLVQDMRPGNLLLLESLRSHPGEAANDPAFARELAAPFDLYVNDAFAASRHAYASTVGMAKEMSERAAGLQLEAEVAALTRLLQSPPRPFVAVLGGAELSPRLGLLAALIGRVDVLCVGGALAYALMRAKGLPTGASRIEEGRVRAASEIVARIQTHGVELLLPEDHVGAKSLAATSAPQLVTGALPPDTVGLDIGPNTRALFVERIAGAKTVLWSGPVGVCEWERFAAGSAAMAAALAACSGFTVVTGDDTVKALEQSGGAGRIGHVSRGGAASVSFLEHGTLPGIRALEGKS